MAALLERQQIGIKKTGGTVTIPNSPVAKMMYYFDCVCHCVDTGKSFALRRLRGYQNYASLTEADITSLLTLCLALSPDKLINKVFFENDKIEGRNKFFEISSISTKLVVSQSLLIGGQQQRVHKIMMFKKEWIELFYIQPIREVLQRRPLALTAPPAQQNRPPPATSRVIVIRQNTPLNAAPVAQQSRPPPPPYTPASKPPAQQNNSNQRRPVVIHCCTIL